MNGTSRKCLYGKLIGTGDVKAGAELGQEPPDVDEVWTCRKKCLDQDLLISFTTNRARCLPHLQALTNFAFLNCVVFAILLMSH